MFYQAVRDIVVEDALVPSTDEDPFMQNRLAEAASELDGARERVLAR